MYVFRVNQNDSEDLIRNLAKQNTAQRAKTLLKEEHKTFFFWYPWPGNSNRNNTYL
jgi:hypothetical protein